MAQPGHCWPQCGSAGVTPDLMAVVGPEITSHSETGGPDVKPEPIKHRCQTEAKAKWILPPNPSQVLKVTPPPCLIHCQGNDYSA